MKIIFTGGHFSPAYAIIKKIRHDNDILVVGRRYAFEGDTNETYEYELCQKEKIPFVAIKAGRLQRKFTRYTLIAAARFPLGIYSALKILRKEKPDVVVTFGGYIGLTVSIAAFLLGIPVVLHEQTQRAGMSAKLISRFASVVLLSFESSKVYFAGKKTVITGNPIREEIFKSYDFAKFHTNLPLVYITGGSAGAHAINMLIADIIKDLTKDYFVVHQTGAQNTNDIAKLIELREQLPTENKKNYIVEKFFSPQEVSYLLKNSTLVISRAGINSVLEFMALGTVALLIPLPFGQHNEQKDNAQLYASTGLGEYLLQNRLDGKTLLKKIRDMIKDNSKYRKNSRKSLKFIRKDAADAIIEQIYLYGRRKERGNKNTSKKT